MEIVLIIIIALFGVLFMGKSGMSAAEKAATEPEPVKRALYRGEAGCMGLLLAGLGAMAVFMILGMAMPGQ